MFGLSFHIPWFGGDFVCFGIVILFVVLMAGMGHGQIKSCPRCHERRRPGAFYCAQCGQRLPGK